jgi:hypothetical protein
MQWADFNYGDDPLWEEIPCMGRSYTLWVGYDPTRPFWRFFRHGDDPDAVLEVPSDTHISYSRPDLLEHVRRWLTRVHREMDEQRRVDRPASTGGFSDEALARLGLRKHPPDGWYYQQGPTLISGPRWGPSGGAAEESTGTSEPSSSAS